MGLIIACLFIPIGSNVEYIDKTTTKFRNVIKNICISFACVMRGVINARSVVTAHACTFDLGSAAAHSKLSMVNF